MYNISNECLYLVITYIYISLGHFGLVSVFNRMFTYILYEEKNVT